MFCLCFVGVRGIVEIKINGIFLVFVIFELVGNDIWEIIRLVFLFRLLVIWGRVVISMFFMCCLKKVIIFCILKILKWSKFFFCEVFSSFFMGFRFIWVYFRLWDRIYFLKLMGVVKCIVNFMFFREMVKLMKGFMFFFVLFVIMVMCVIFLLFLEY